MTQLQIIEYTDPACPFAWSAEPSRRRLQWLYGDSLDWELRMVGLARTVGEVDESGFTPERQSASFRSLAERHHMPMDTAARPRMSATVPACKAVVAVRWGAPEREAAMLRALRVLNFSGWLLDEPATLAAAAQRAGVDPQALQEWLAEPATDELLQADLDASRNPTPQALALSHKLAKTENGGFRYTCPSYEIEHAPDGDALAVPGFQPLASYEVAIANLAPETRRRDDPEDVGEVLTWAAEPLATAEVAAVCVIGLEEARERLGRVASEEHIGFDGLWRLN